MNEYDISKYEIDFPDIGDFNWKTVKLKNTNYYNGCKIIGVVLHDGNFMVNGVLFLKHQFDIIDENPIKINNKYFMKVEYECYGCISETDLMFDTEKEALDLKIGYEFLT